jgi:hypothetical protein
VLATVKRDAVACLHVVLWVLHVWLRCDLMPKIPGSGSCPVFVARLIRLIMNWSVPCSCFASCSNRRVQHMSLQHAAEAEGRRGLVRSLPARKLRTPKTNLLVMRLATNKKQQQQQQPNLHITNKTSPRVSLSLLSFSLSPHCHSLN